MNQSPTNLDEQIDKILESVIGLDARTEYAKGAIDEAHAKLTKLISLQETKVVINELESFIGHSNEIPEHVLKSRITELNSNLSKGNDEAN